MTAAEEAQDQVAVEMEKAINAEMEERAFRFGPISIRRHDFRHPETFRGWIAVDANGRRTAIDRTFEAHRAVRALHDRHKHRMVIDREIEQARETIGTMFHGLHQGRIEVAYRDSLDGRRDSFLGFHVVTTLLTTSLRWERHMIDYRPYSSSGTDLVRLRHHQRRRQKMLEKRDRRSALTCCPVLAARIGAADNPTSWADLVQCALDDQASADMPHFIDGMLVHPVEIARGIWWAGGALKAAVQMPEAVVASLPGRPLSDVVEHAWLPDYAVIASVKRRGKTIKFRAKLDGVPLAPVIEDLVTRGGTRITVR